jgi:hypothetical protein
MRNREQDETWIRDTVKQAGLEGVVYVVPNHYDGGYEVRIEAADVFVDYGTIDSHEQGWLERLCKKVIG